MKNIFSQKLRCNFYIWIRIQQLKIMWICIHSSNKPKIKAIFFLKKGALLLLNIFHHSMFVYSCVQR
jgi:hypothetical protein